MSTWIKYDNSSNLVTYLIKYSNIWLRGMTWKEKIQSINISKKNLKEVTIVNLKKTLTHFIDSKSKRTVNNNIWINK
jgi:hypothetical protein